MIRVLKKIGFGIAREGGNHTILRRGGILVPVPRHPGDLSRSTFHKILRQAGISQEDYVRLR